MTYLQVVDLVSQLASSKNIHRIIRRITDKLSQNDIKKQELSMNYPSLSFAFIILLLSCGCIAIAQAPSTDFDPVTDAMLQDPDPADWPMWRRTLDGWGYSPLAQINRDNVGGLQLVWTRPLIVGPPPKGKPLVAQEGTPLVYDGVMYMPNPKDVTQAIDAATGELIWEYHRLWPDDVGSYIVIPGANRNIAIYENLIIDTSTDGYVYALDATTGEHVWENQIYDYRIHTANHSAGPIIANSKIISGRNCQSEGGPDACVITAHDAQTGRELWRTRTIPAQGEPGSDTWGDVPFEKRWHVGTWMVPSFDPELNLVYIGTSVTSPAPKFMLGSNDNQYLYHNSTLALDADTGKIVWYYQHLVDHWDLDHVFERLLIDTAVTPNPSEVSWINPNLKSGEMRKVLTGIPGKTGVIYTLDRETGEFLWARPTVTQTIINTIDGATGQVSINQELLFTAPGQERYICPAPTGGKNWPAGAYSPLTNVMYYSLQNTCTTMTATTLDLVFNFEGTPGKRQKTTYGIRHKPHIAPGTENVGTVQAISVETGEVNWKYEQRSAMMSLVTTGSGLIFGGDSHGVFRAFDQTAGDILFEVNLGSEITGYPITYAVDGRQYVAVSTGTSITSRNLNKMTPELNQGVATNLFVFALPQNN